MKPTKTQATIGILIILLLVAGGYILDKEYIEPEFESYYQQGGLDVYFEFGDLLSQCNQVPIVLRNNQTVNAFLVECLNQG